MNIFISHSSKDKTLIDKFVEKILILGCGIKDNQIFCSSIEGLGIKNGEDFRNHIREKLKNSNLSFIMISENYKKSEVCLNEMGASWAQDELKIKQFLFPNLDFSSLGLLLNVQQASKIDNSADLDILFEELAVREDSRNNIARWNKHKSDFLINTKEYLHEQSISNAIPKDYFESYVKENVSLNHLLLKAHPTLLDCQTIFSKDYYEDFFVGYCSLFSEIQQNYMKPLYPEYKFVRVERTDTMELLGGINKIAGGMLQAAEKGYFNYNVDFYAVTFLKNKNSEHGLTYKVFCFVNNRWVFIPKPWNYNALKTVNSKFTSRWTR